MRTIEVLSKEVAHCELLTFLNRITCPDSNLEFRGGSDFPRAIRNTGVVDTAGFDEQAEDVVGLKASCDRTVLLHGNVKSIDLAQPNQFVTKIKEILLIPRRLSR
jgi:hypothetical protein